MILFIQSSFIAQHNSFGKCCEIFIWITLICWMLRNKLFRVVSLVLWIFIWIIISIYLFYIICCLQIWHEKIKYSWFMFIFHLMFISSEEKKKKVSKVQNNMKRIPNAWCQCAKDVKQKSAVVQLNWSESCQTKYMYLYLFRHFHWNCSWTVPNGSSSTEQNTNIYTFMQT